MAAAKLIDRAISFAKGKATRSVCGADGRTRLPVTSLYSGNLVWPLVAWPRRIHKVWPNMFSRV